MRSLRFFLFFFIIVIGCQNLNNDINNKIKTFDLKEFSKISEVKLSDLDFVDIEYIPLETNENSLIPKIKDIKVDSSFYIIQYFNDILKFRTNGSFLTRIGKEGRGPGEYLVTHDVDIDEINHNIYLLDGWARKFTVYTANGEFLRTFKSPFNAINFKLTRDGILCFSTNYIANVDTSFVLIDTSGKVLKKFLNKYTWKYKVQGGTVVFTENIFYRFDNLLFKKEIYSDTIYLFEDKVFKPQLIIEHGNRLLTSAARSNFDRTYLMENFISQKKLLEFGNYIYYQFGIGSLLNYKEYGFICSKKDHYQSLFNLNQGLINDLDGGPNILPRAIKDDNTIVFWVDALRLKAHIASEAFKNSIPKYPEKKKELEKLANGLKETDNPVLMLVRMKK